MKQWIIPYIKTFKSRIIWALLIDLLSISSGAMLLFMSGYLISESALQPANIMILYVPIVSVRAFSIARAVFAYIEKLISHDLVLRILKKMRKALYDIVRPQALFLQTRYQTGDLLNVLADDIERLQDLYLRTIFPSITGLMIYIIIITIFGSFDLLFGMISALMFGTIAFLIPFLSFFLIYRHHKERKAKRQTIYRKLTDAIFGMSDWQASGRVQEFLENISQNDQQTIQVERTMQKLRHMRDGLIELIIGFSIIAVMIWSSMQANIDIIAPTVIAAFVLMTFSITEVLAPISEATEHIPTYADAIERIQTIENKKLPKNDYKVEKWRNDSETTIKVTNISYAYPNTTKHVINRLTVTIESKEKIAILGRSGTGKSTFLKLLAGVLTPDQGSITINNHKMHSGLLSQAVSVLNQKPHLFATSIANNIRIGRPDATDEEVLHVANLAQLTPLIESLPEGMHTHMQEMGHRFSGGERQRIAFARVLLQDTPILLIDEATIGLDPRTEQRFIQTIFQAASDKTILWVTHHLAGIEQMDRVIFMQNGNIAIQGSHEHLLETNNYYKQLYLMDQRGDEHC